ncbi:Cytochrome P450 [Amycolatopsis arida]|uniref:Cytochrome P450 n=1 Tax=Amycolatopsis arida TaxID=587909 RepID=A0A1I5LW58_9PSEU|nr:cytochrome P450 [Amycolatopsis arida]TDX93870.1 cytochrome P450 [Amycolatopsis arida]SFP01413.1 Cytochrome P450 [Amycolatopsis arida]
MGETSLPPGPALPTLVQTYLLWRHPERFLTACRRRYGPTFRVRALPYGVRVHVADPADIRRVFKGDPKVFHAGEGIATALGSMLGEHSLLALDEDDHQRQRRPMMRPFRGDTMRGYLDAIAAIAAESVRGWPVGRPFSLHPFMRRITIEVIVRVVLGTEAGTRRDRLRVLLTDVLEMGASEMIGWKWPLLARIGPWRRHRRMFAELEALLMAEVRDRGADPALAERADVLSVLLRESAGELTDVAVRDHLVTLLIAGYETTATALAWAFECITGHPEIQRGLVEDDAYLDAAIRESLRLRPIFFEISPRRLTEPVELGGYLLPEGTMVTPSVGVVHLSADHYERPAEFRPERWLRKSDGHQPWLPFGGGVRRCVGAEFAQREMAVVVRTVLRRGELRRAGAPERARPRHVTLVPSRGARVTFHPHRAGRGGEQDGPAARAG